MGRHLFLDVAVTDPGVGAAEVSHASEVPRDAGASRGLASEFLAANYRRARGHRAKDKAG